MPTVKLKTAVNHDGKTYESLSVEEPSVGAIETFENAQKAGKSEMSAMIEMLAVDCKMPADALRLIKISDLMAISEAMEPFLEALKPASGGTGGPSAQTSATS